jgi:hypothetical protein
MSPDAVGIAAIISGTIIVLGLGLSAELRKQAQRTDYLLQEILNKLRRPDDWTGMR